MSAHDILMSAAGGTSLAANYVEDVFSTYLYTGNGATQTITNGIDLAGEGGLVWSKVRSGSANHELTDTVTGANKRLASDTNGSQNNFGDVSGFLSNGYTLRNVSGNINGSGKTVVGWTFRKQPKFFDVVTYTGDGATQTINHNLGSTPGMIIVKNITGGDGWRVWTNALTVNEYLTLSDTSGKLTASGFWGSSLPNSTTFQLGTYDNNRSGATYVAYLFAHNAGGFGLTGTDNVISCGFFFGTGSLTLGFEPQWVLTKPTNTTGDWEIFDTMRGLPVSGNSQALFPNTSGAESSVAQVISPTATGFNFTSPSVTRIYIAIRRGPMKLPTVGTEVFAPVTYSGDSASSRTITGASFPPDLSITKTTSRSHRNLWFDRLRGKYRLLISNNTDSEFENTSTLSSFNMNGISIGNTGETTFDMNFAGTNYINWMFRRAPGFFDEVCYTGTGSARTVAHNLAAVPELMIVKRRNASQSWGVYAAPIGNTKYLQLGSTAAPVTNTLFWNDTSPTNDVFTVGTNTTVNASGGTYIAYLFASCPGVSKVGSYTGTGATQTINCGFTGGARFVMIKRTDSTGDWYVWDSARGIVAGDDPYLLLNSSAAEVTNTDYIDPFASGFEISSTAPAAINANGGSFIFLAIA
jgi:hypothetical protein